MSAKFILETDQPSDCFLQVINFPEVGPLDGKRTTCPELLYLLVDCGKLIDEIGRIHGGSHK
jgi:hypothetical protein